MTAPYNTATQTAPQTLTTPSTSQGTVSADPLEEIFGTVLGTRVTTGTQLADTLKADLPSYAPSMTAAQAQQRVDAIESTYRDIPQGLEIYSVPEGEGSSIIQDTAGIALKSAILGSSAASYAAGQATIPGTLSHTSAGINLAHGTRTAGDAFRDYGATINDHKFNVDTSKVSSGMSKVNEVTQAAAQKVKSDGVTKAAAQGAKTAASSTAKSVGNAVKTVAVDTTEAVAKSGAVTASRAAGMGAVRAGGRIVLKSVATLVSFPVGTIIGAGMLLTDPLIVGAVRKSLSFMQGHRTPSLESEPSWDEGLHYLTLTSHEKRDVVIREQDAEIHTANVDSFNFPDKQIWHPTNPDIVTTSDFASFFDVYGQITDLIRAAGEETLAALTKYQDDPYVNTLTSNRADFIASVADATGLYLNPIVETISEPVIAYSSAYAALRDVIYTTRYGISTSDEPDTALWGMVANPFYDMDLEAKDIGDVAAMLKQAVADMDAANESLAKAGSEWTVPQPKAPTAAANLTDADMRDIESIAQDPAAYIEKHKTLEDMADGIKLPGMGEEGEGIDLPGMGSDVEGSLSAPTVPSASLPSTPRINTPTLGGVTAPSSSGLNLSSPSSDGGLNLKSPNSSSTGLNLGNIPSSPTAGSSGLKIPDITSPGTSSLKTPTIDTPKLSGGGLSGAGGSGPSTPSFSTPNLDTPKIETPKVPTIETPKLNSPDLDTSTSGSTGPTAPEIPDLKTPTLTKPDTTDKNGGNVSGLPGTTAGTTPGTPGTSTGGKDGKTPTVTTPKAPSTTQNPSVPTVKNPEEDEDINDVKKSDTEDGTNEVTTPKRDPAGVTSPAPAPSTHFSAPTVSSPAASSPSTSSMGLGDVAAPNLGGGLGDVLSGSGEGSDPTAPNEGGDIDPNDPAANPEGTSTEPAREPTNITRDGQVFEMGDTKAAKMAELLNPSDGSEGMPLREAAAEAGFKVPPAGFDMGTPISPADIQPGDVIVGDGIEGVYVGDGLVLTSEGLLPLAEVAVFVGPNQGIFRLDGNMVSEDSLATGQDATATESFRGGAGTATDTKSGDMPAGLGGGGLGGGTGAGRNTPKSTGSSGDPFDPVNNNTSSGPDFGSLKVTGTGGVGASPFSGGGVSRVPTGD